MADGDWRTRFRWLFLPLAAVALAWTVWLLWDAWPGLERNLPHLKPRWLLWTLLGNTISGYLAFEAFRVLFNHLRPGVYGRGALAQLYFAGQVMKHLPGRVWGIAYQSTMGQRASVAEWISVTAVYMVLSVGFALWVAASVLGLMFGWPWGLLGLGIGAVIYFQGWRAGWLTKLLQLARKLPMRSVTRLCDALTPFVAVPLRFKWQLWVWFTASWLIYLAAWAGYGLAWPGLAAVDGIWLCAIYTVAWFVGYASLLTPSGLGVRELVFVVLAHDFPPDAVAGMAVLGRVVLLGVDVLLGMVFVPRKGEVR